MTKLGHLGLLLTLFGACLSTVTAKPLTDGHFDVNRVAPVNMDEYGDLFQGDINGISNEADLRNALADKSKRWAGGNVPYRIDSGRFSSQELAVIYAAIAEYHQTTCIRFVERTTEQNYVFITPKTGCNSYVGNIGIGAQSLSLGTGCVYKGVVVHELMHAIGFWHEHSRTDRDSYVDIFWQYIQNGYAFAFDKYGPDKIDMLGTQYDYGSIMHYGKTAFSIDRNRYNTIVPKQAGIEIGQRVGLSTNDLVKINKLYECPM